MGMFHRHGVGKIRDTSNDGGESVDGALLIVNPSPVDTHSPMGPQDGTLTANPHTAGHWSNDLDHSPIIYNRFATRWADIQLKNGLANGVASGRINSYRGEGWYDVVVPVVPGQTRLIGTNHSGYFPAKGPAPSQWQDNFNQGPGSQPLTPGGPGQMVGTDLYNPGSGG
jgi:hypothetical protein